MGPSTPTGPSLNGLPQSQRATRSQHPHPRHVDGCACGTRPDAGSSGTRLCAPPIPSCITSGSASTLLQSFHPCPASQTRTRMGISPRYLLPKRAADPHGTKPDVDGVEREHGRDTEMMQGQGSCATKGWERRMSSGRIQGIPIPRTSIQRVDTRNTGTPYTANPMEDMRGNGSTISLERLQLSMEEDLAQWEQQS